MTKVRGVQLVQEHSATRRGQVKIQDLLKKYVAPMRNKQEFENEIENYKTQLLDEENTKEMLRSIFEEVTGSKANIPPELRKKTVVAAKKTVETLHGVVWGYNPFTNEKEKLEYQKKEDWADFKEKATESVNIGDKQVMIPSLTVEKMISQAEESGLSMKSLGRLARCFVEAALPAVASKVNNIHDEDIGEIFNVIETAIDVEEEIRLVERSIEGVKREPGKFDLADVVHNYLGKQLKLTQLRTGLTQREELMKRKIYTAAEELAKQALYNMVSREVQMYLLEDVQPRYVMTKQELTLEKMIKEATMAEKERPEWRIKTTVRPPVKMYGTVNASSAELGGNINQLDGQNDDALDEDNREMREEGIFEDDNGYEDQYFEDEEGEIRMLSGVRRVQLRRSNRKSMSPGTKRRTFSPSPYRGKVTMIKKWEKSRSRDRSRNGSRQGGRRSGSPGRPRPGSSGGGRGKPVWRRERERRRPGVNSRSPAKKTPSRSPGRKRCLRCNSENHLASSCPRYGKYCTVPCPICKSQGIFPQFHPAAVCLRNSSSNYKSPSSRSNSPATKEKYGFSNGFNKRGKSPVAISNRTKNE